MDENFCRDIKEHMNLMSISYIYVKVDASLNPQIMDLLERWNPKCGSIKWNENTPLRTAVKLVEAVEAAENTRFVVDFDDFNAVKEVLLQSPLCRNFFLEMDDWIEGNILDNMKHFGGFSITANGRTVTQFMEELYASKDPGALTKVIFRYPGHDGISLPPGTTEIFARIEKINYDKIDTHTFEKLLLNNKYYVMEWMMNGSSDVHGRYQSLEISILENVQEEKQGKVLDFVLDKLKICEKFFSAKRRMEYLEMDDQERFDQLSMAYNWHETLLHTERHLFCSENPRRFGI